MIAKNLSLIGCLGGNFPASIELLKNGANNGALNESITAGSDLIRKAQHAFDGVAPNRYTDALFSLGDALCDMFDQLRV